MAMRNYIGQIIETARKRLNETQEVFGARYQVSGPAIFKFENGYVRPSIELCMKMAKDVGVDERRAVLLWIKAKLPARYQEYIELQSGFERMRGRGVLSGISQGRAVSPAEQRGRILALGKSSPEIPRGIVEFLSDDELWALYKPTVREIEQLIEIYAPMGEGTAELYRQGLCLLRDFTGTAN